MRRGSNSLGMGRGFNSATNSLNLASISLQCLPRFSPRFLPRSHHDRATIGRRSWCYWFVDRRPFDRLRFCGEISSIAARSRFDRAAIVEFFHELPTPLDLNPSLQRSGRQIGIRRFRDLHEEGQIAFTSPSDRNPMLSRSSRKEADRASLGRRIGEVR